MPRDLSLGGGLIIPALRMPLANTSSRLDSGSEPDCLGAVTVAN